MVLWCQGNYVIAWFIWIFKFCVDVIEIIEMDHRNNTLTVSTNGVILNHVRTGSPMHQSWLLWSSKVWGHIEPKSWYFGNPHWNSISYISFFSTTAQPRPQEINMYQKVSLMKCNPNTISFIWLPGMIPHVCNHNDRNSHNTHAIELSYLIQSM